MSWDGVILGAVRVHTVPRLDLGPSSYVLSLDPWRCASKLALENKKVDIRAEAGFRCTSPRIERQHIAGGTQIESRDHMDSYYTENHAI